MTLIKVHKEPCTYNNIRLYYVPFSALDIYIVNAYAISTKKYGDLFYFLDKLFKLHGNHVIVDPKSISKFLARYHIINVIMIVLFRNCNRW